MRGDIVFWGFVAAHIYQIVLLDQDKLAPVPLVTDLRHVDLKVVVKTLAVLLFKHEYETARVLIKVEIYRMIFLNVMTVARITAWFLT